MTTWTRVFIGDSDAQEEWWPETYSEQEWTAAIELKSGSYHYLAGFTSRIHLYCFCCESLEHAKRCHEAAKPLMDALVKCFNKSEQRAERGQ